MARRRRAPGSQSAGYHYDATVKAPRKTRTPIKAPSKGQAARGPAGDYRGSQKDFDTAVATLPPAARSATELATVAAAVRQAKASGARRSAVRAAAQATRQRQRQARSTVERRQQRRRRLLQSTDPAKAIIGSKPNPLQKPLKFAGKPTAGEPTRGELQAAKQAGTLKVNKKGFATTPKVRTAAKGLQRAKGIEKRAGAVKDLPYLDPEGDKVGLQVLRTGDKRGATDKELLAAAMTGLVESSGFHNLGYGDADSEGWRQERTSIYGTSEPRNVKAGAKNFFEESISDTGGSRGKGMTAGELAQAIQGSAFPERYDERAAEAAAIVNAYKKGTLTPQQERKIARLRGDARKVGLKAAKGTKGRGTLKARKVKGEWAGTKDILLNVTKGFSITSEKRTPAENASVGGAEDSDHLTTNTNTYATDLPASGAELNQIGSTVAKRLRIKGWTPGNYNWYTSPRFPGYRFQILSEVDGHFDHVHAGAEWTGEDLPPGTMYGGVVSGGGGSASVSAVSGMAASSYATATGQSVKSVRKKVRSGELTPQQIYKKLERLGVGVGGDKGRPSDRAAEEPHRVLDELKEKYGSGAPVPTRAAERKAKQLTAATTPANG